MLNYIGEYRLRKLNNQNQSLVIAGTLLLGLGGLGAVILLAWEIYTLIVHGRPTILTTLFN
jgi:hypothetical protein